MRPSDILLQLFTFFLPPALIGSAYLYLYPVLQLCAFPEARPAEAACHFGDAPRAAVPGEAAPFRLLAFADPQLEGDTAVSLAGAPGAAAAASWLARARKRLDLWGNDRYLAHVRRSVRWWTAPTHVVVLGDLLGSQWIGDEEFEQRAGRFWGTVFAGFERVPRSVTGSSGRKEVLGRDEAWKRRIIAVPGNHDTGYAGDVDKARVERFEEAFGDVNWEVTFKLNGSDGDGGRGHDAAGMGIFGAPAKRPSPELRLLMVNSMNLDGPAADQELQDVSRNFVTEHLFNPSVADSTATILLTHIPLHKQSGVCTDAPFFSYFEADRGGGLKEQNHLSEDVSEKLLSGLAGKRSPLKGLIMNGHDHAGCDTYHRRVHGNTTWTAHRYQQGMEVMDTEATGFREITVQSMMGDFWGNVGLLSAWWDKDAEEWRFEYATCPLGVQHIWWAVHIFDIVVFLGFGLGGLVSAFWEEYSDHQKQQKAALMRKKQT